MSIDPLELSRRVIAGNDLTRDETRSLLTLEGDDLYDLFYAANRVRRHFHGNKATFCSILPTKFGNCSEDCGFCAKAPHFDTGIKPHAMMSGDEVRQATTSRSRQRSQRVRHRQQWSRAHQTRMA
jgi:biotin synthase